MDLLTGWGGSLLGTLIPFLVVLTIVVFFHELGHFLVARWCGVAVKTFSIGFGPELFGFDDRHGTRWRLAAIPLGGYVKFIDDMNAASAPDRAAAEAAGDGSFQSKSVWRRAAIVAAGPIANFILAIAIYTVLFATLGKPVVAPVVDAVMPGTAAEEAGFQPGDRVLTIDGKPIESFNALHRVVSRSAGLELNVVVERAGAPVEIAVTPRIGEIKDVFGNTQQVGMIGLQRNVSEVRVISYGPLEAVGEAFVESKEVLSATLGYLGGVLVGRESPSQIGGPIGIAKVSGQAASLGIIPLINLAAVLSISIGMLNLFPIPLLDGGHLVYYAIEAVRGRPLSERAQDYGFRIGFAIVLMLMVLGTFNDIVRLATG
jgi:regulator of sigma E protease